MIEYLAYGRNDQRFAQNGGTKSLIGSYVDIWNQVSEDRWIISITVVEYSCVLKRLDGSWRTALMRRCEQSFIV